MAVDFVAAYRAFDSSRAGLVRLPAERREPQAVSLLRLAECLILRADAELAPRVGLGPGEAPGQDEPGLWLSPDAGQALDGLASDSLLAALLLRQSIANWRPHRRDHWAPIGDEPRSALTSAHVKLARAAEVLDTAERILSRTRRSVEWWSCLFQLRARIEIERILIFTAGGREHGLARERRAGTSAVSAEYINHFMVAIKRGLQAVRRGLDVLLPVHRSLNPATLATDHQFVRFLRLWMELMLYGARATVLSNTKKQLSAAELWEQWRHLNRLASIVRLQNVPEVRTRFEDWYTHELMPRASATAVQDQGQARVPTPSALLERADAIVSVASFLGPRPGDAALELLDCRSPFVA